MSVYRLQLTEFSTEICTRFSAEFHLKLENQLLNVCVLNNIIKAQLKVIFEENIKSSGFNGSTILFRLYNKILMTV